MMTTTRFAMMTTTRFAFCVLLALSVLGGSAPADTAPPITRVWLTHQTNDPSRIVVSWLSEKPGDSVVLFGLTHEYGHTVRIDGNATLHHVEIPLTEQGTVVHYRVSTGEQTSAPGRFKTYPTDVLRVAVVANWQGKPDLAALVADDPHILMTAGDNISNIYPLCGENRPECILPYAKLVEAYPEMFRSTPVMPVLGNHDKQIRPRGPAPPEEPVYDVSAKAFCRFFALPDAGWRWRFDVPAFNVRFIALDFHHISDQGTTWQSSHDFHEESEQFLWYKALMADTGGRTVVTLYNARSASIRNQVGGAWHDMFRKGTICVTGFGHYGERAEVDGFTYYDISLHGKGTPYPDPHSKFLAREHNYLLMTFDRAARTMTVDLKSLAGEVLDRKVFGQAE